MPKQVIHKKKQEESNRNEKGHAFRNALKETQAVALAKISRDISRREEVEAALKSSEKLYRNLFENMLHGFVYCRVIFEGDKATDYVATAVNTAYEELTGLTGVLGSKISEVIPGIRESHPEIFEMIGRVALSGKSEKFETYILNRWLSVSMYCPERGFFVGLVDNITERKTVEVIQSEKLERLVEERTNKLNESLQKEKILVDLKGKFVAIASHEFRTPLSIISFAAGSIRNYFHELTEAEIMGKLVKIEDQANHMSDLLEDILTLGKSEAGKTKLKRIHLDLKAFIDSLIDEVRSTLKVKRVINFTFASVRQEVNVDDKLLRNVVNNLLTNGIKFSSADTAVSIVVSDNEKDVVIEVIDEGIGIEESELTSVFESFQRGSNASTIQGTGLGLSIIKKAVELMEGSIEVKSCLNKGSTFRVQFPIR